MKHFKSALAALAALAALIGLTPDAGAVATIYWAAAGEDIDFTCSGTCTTSTNTANFRSSYVRAAQGISGTTGDPPTNLLGTNATFTNASTIWIHAQLCEGSGAGNCSATTTGTLNEQLIRIIDTSSNATLIVRGTGNAGEVKISSRTAGGVFTDLVTCPGAISATLTPLDIQVVYALAGTLTVYNNKVQVCTFSGDTRNGDGAANLNNIAFGALSTGNTMYWSEIVVGDSDSRQQSVWNLPTNGNGNATTWTGTNICSSIWAAVSEADGNFGSTGTNNALQQCTIANTLPPGAFTVDAVAMTARALRAASGPQHFDFSTRTGGSDFASSDQAPGTTYTNFGPFIQATNPNTTVQWVTGDLTAAGFNIGLKSTP